MAKCAFCGQKVQKKQACSNCGEYMGEIPCVLKTPDGKTSRATINITKNFLVIDAGASIFRLIIETSLYYVFGALLGFLLDILGAFLIKNKTGFIDVNDIYSIIIASPEKKKSKFKIVLVNGTEIVGEGLREKDIPLIIQIFKKAEVNVVMGTPNDVLYTNPYTTNMDDLKFGVCPAATKFIKISKKQRVMPPIENLVITDGQ